MAVNTNPMFASGQRLTPEQIKQMMAIARKPGLQSMGEAGEMTGGGTASLPGKFGPEVKWVPKQVQTGSGDATQTVDDPSGAGSWVISQPRNVSTMGGNDVTDLWDEQGNYLGQSSAQTDARGLATIVAAALGGAYANGGFGAATGAGEAGGGLTALGEAGGYGTAGAEGFAASDGLTALGDVSLAGDAATTAAGSSTKAALYSGDAYGTGMTGAETSAFDAGLNAGATTAGTSAAANGAARVAGTQAAGTGFDLLNSPVGRAASGALITGVAGGVSDALKPDVNTSNYDKLFESMLSDAKLARDRGTDLWDNYVSTFRPLEQQLAQRAATFDTPDRRESEAQAAAGQVASAFDQTRQSATEDMVKAGLDPSTIAALGSASRIDEAKAKAGASNLARNNVEQQGLALLDSTARFGRGLPATSAQQSGLAASSNNSAVNTTNAGNNASIAADSSRNAIFGDVLGAGLKAYGMGLFNGVGG